jgi:hypothetical protein
MAPKGGSSRHRGVTWDKRRSKWRAQAVVRGRCHFLGLFSDEQDAASRAKAFRDEHMPYANPMREGAAS